MNPNCPDPSYPEWDEIAQGCKAIARAVVSSNPTGWWIAFGVIIAGVIIAVRFFDAR